MKLRDSLIPLIFIIATLLISLPILVTGSVINTASGDTPFVFFKLQQMHASVTQFVFPVRWMSDAALGLGYPTFNYDSSLAFYVAAIFKILGASYSLALKLTQLLALLLSAFTMYGWLRALNLNQFAAALAALAYLFAPFHLVQLFARADSLGELFAFALYPLALHLTQLATVTPSSRACLFLSLTLSALLLSHPPSAFIFLPFLLVYWLLTSVMTRSFDLRHSSFVILSVVFSLALTAFHWFPAWRELNYIRAENPAVTGFLGFDLIQLSFLFNYDASSYGLSWIQLLLIAFGVFALFARRPEGQASVSLLFRVFFVAGFLAASFMLTPLSQLVWELVPMLNLVQYTWRFSLPQTLFASVLIGFILQSAAVAEFSFKQLITDTRVRVVLIGFGVYCLIHLLGIRPDYITLNDVDVTPQRLQLYEFVSGNIGATREAAYLPKWVEAQPTSSDEFTKGSTLVSLRPLNGVATGERTGKGAASQTWRVVVSSNTAIVALPVLYFPGWTGTVDGKNLDLRRIDGLGWIGFEVPQGEHKVELNFGNTLARSAASAVSLVAGLLWLGLTLYSLRTLPDIVTLANAIAYGGAILVVLVFFVVVERFISLQATPSNVATMDLARQPYLHSDEVRFKNDEVLRSYTLSSETPAPGDVLTVTLLWQGKGRGDFTLELVSPSSSSTITRVNGKASNVPVSATLPIPNDLSGVYLLRLLYTENGVPQSALTSNGSPRDQLFLKPLRVTGEGRGMAATPRPPGQRTTELPPLKFKSSAVFGPINLAGYDISLKQRVLSLSLVWQASAPAPKNYKMFIHVFDPVTGKIVAQSDAYPGLPTTTWVKNEVVTQTETFALAQLPRGLYNIGVGWYDEATGQRMGDRFILNQAIVIP